MLHTTLYYGLLGLLAIALLIAAITDLKRREIDNWLNVAIAVTAPVFWWAGGLTLWPGMALQLGMAIAAFAVAAVLFAIRQMGGGDVKLIAALALWFPPPLFANFLIVMAVLGYVLTMGLGVLRVGRASGRGRNDLVVLSALSLVAAVLIAAFAGVVALPLPEFMRDAAGSSIFLAVLVVQLPVLVLGFVSYHAIRIFRRHQVNLAAPYGVAISGAGLWLIIGQFGSA